MTCLLIPAPAVAVTTSMPASSENDAQPPMASMDISKRARVEVAKGVVIVMAWPAERRGRSARATATARLDAGERKAR